MVKLIEDVQNPS